MGMHIASSQAKMRQGCTSTHIHAKSMHVKYEHLPIALLCKHSFYLDVLRCLDTQA